MKAAATDAGNFLEAGTESYYARLSLNAKGKLAQVLALMPVRVLSYISC